jgi:protein-L-isoaspartate(D-aspartate) O-methyltransferase
MQYSDNYRHKGLRKKLVEGLKRKGISDEAILEAIGTIPRHYFLDQAFDDWAYKDVAFPIDADQTISQPFTVAMQTQLLKVKPKDKILEIGTGSGYQACVLSYLGAKVYTIERQEKLYLQTSEFLPEIGFGNIRTLFGDGFKGAPRFAPFDKILITAAAPEIPGALLEQLKVGGYLVIPLGEGEIQEMLRLTKVSDKKIKKEKFGSYRFVPLLKGVNKYKK